jgi:tRNA (guanine37-N1)-methyltransferase
MLKEFGLRLDGYQLQKVAGTIGIALRAPPSAKDESVLRMELGSFEIRESPFQPIVSRPRNLQDAARDLLPSHMLPQLPKSFDIIGDIAIINLPPELETYSNELGKCVLQVNPHIRLVLKKSGDVTGKFRTREFQVLAGSGGMETVHHEFGCRYHLDVPSVYFNPRLAHERRRVAEQVREGETVVDMFAGVGPYSILIAKLQPRSRLCAADINPSAVKYLRENVIANQVADRVTPCLGDARELSRGQLKKVADRVIMNLPSEAVNYLDAAVQVLKGSGGIVHFYQFLQRDGDLNSVKEQLGKSVAAQGRAVHSVGYCKVIREIAPNKVQVALDALIK